MTKKVSDKKKRMYTGEVVSNKMDKTIVVKTERILKHPLFHKTIRKEKKYKVSGYHNWIKYYYDERYNNVDYNGIIKSNSVVNNYLSTIKYRWGKNLKPIGGFLVGVSPEFDFAIATLGLFSNQKDIRITIDNKIIGLKTYKNRNSSKILKPSTSYAYNLKEKKKNELL